MRVGIAVYVSKPMYIYEFRRKVMKRNFNRVQRRFIQGGAVLVIALLIITICFGVHCHNVNVYNDTVHTISGTSEADENGISINIHQRGNSTDIWDKADDYLGTTIKGMIYEATVTNASGYELSEWSLLQNVTEKGFVNNAWCGTLEITQNLENETKTQTLDLRNLNRDALELDYHMSATDVLITLNPSDTITYHPSTKDKEMPIDAGGNVTAGIIVYSYDEDYDFSDFTFEYKLQKGYLELSDATGFIIALTLWLIFMLAYIFTVITAVRYEKKLKENDRIVKESLDVFTNFVDAKDPYTKGHSSRVAEYSQRIAEKLGFDEDRCRQIYYVALLHDIGKCYVPDEILKKPSRLTDEEFAIIKTHTTHGAKMVRNFSSIEDIRDGALFHHERYDGKGYPTGCEGEDIPLIARIICVADAYDAMNSNRVYRTKLTQEAIKEELKKNKGTQFDPKIVDVFLQVLDDMAAEENNDN